MRHLLAPLATQLGVSLNALQQLGVTLEEDVWHYPERDAGGEEVGTNRRFGDGTKRATQGSQRGLCYALDDSFSLDADAGASSEEPVLVVEGMTDTAVGMDLGFATVGRSTATPGRNEMAWLVELLAGRHVAVVAEHDDSGVGMTGATKVAEALAARCPLVKVVEPPEDVKDLRVWKTAHDADRPEVLAAIRGAEVVVLPAASPREHRDKPKAPRSAPDLICMADVTPADIRWLWPGRIPLGRMTLLVGRPGDGKSFLASYLAATVSLGRDWTDGAPCPRGSVLLCSAEDDSADTLAPRLIAHGADLKRIHLLAGVTPGHDHDRQTQRVFTLADLDPLRQALERHNDCRLIIVDPIGSYLGGNADAHRDNEVRSILAPACLLAQQHDAALVVVAHTRKAAAAYADDLAMGSRAFTGLARSVLHLLMDPDDATKQRRLLLPGKNNLVERPPGSHV